MRTPTTRKKHSRTGVEDSGLDKRTGHCTRLISKASKASFSISIPAKYWRSLASSNPDRSIAASRSASYFSAVRE